MKEKIPDIITMHEFQLSKMENTLQLESYSSERVDRDSARGAVLTYVRANI